MECILATMSYLENILETQEENDEDDENLQFIIRIKSILTESVASFLYKFQKTNTLIDTFISLDIYGLYVLVQKSDCDGFFSPGNALDIFILLQTIKPFIMNEFVAEYMVFLIPVFQKSMEINTRITIF
jgi:hypothetical protein